MCCVDKKKESSSGEWCGQSSEFGWRGAVIQVNNDGVASLWVPAPSVQCFVALVGARVGGRFGHGVVDGLDGLHHGGGKHKVDAAGCAAPCYSCRSFFAKEPLIIGLFCGKCPGAQRRGAMLPRAIRVGPSAYGK